MRAAGILALTVLALLCGTVNAQHEALRIGVVDFTSDNVPDAQLRILSDRLRIELHNTGEFTVVERDRMEDILGEQGFQLSGCVDTYCVIEAGRLLGAEKMVAGSIGQVGPIITVSLRMIDMRTGTLERTALHDCECSVQEVLTQVIAKVSAELAGLSWTPPASVAAQPLARGEGVGMLFVESTPPGGRIIVNGRPSRETTPATLRNVPAGEYIVRVVHENLFAEQRVRVVRDDLAKISLTLRPGTGSLFVESEPVGANVFLDGVNMGSTPVLIRDARAGAHRLRVTKQHYSVWEEDIVVEHERRGEVAVTLVPVGYVTVAVDPVESQVWLDGTVVARNQRTNLQVSVGMHRVTATHTDRDTAVVVFDVSHGQTSSIRLAPAKRFASLHITSAPSGARISSVPSGIGGETPYSFERVEPGRYTINLWMDDRVPFGQTVVLEKGETKTIHGVLRFTDEYLERAEAERQVRAARRQAMMKRGVRWTSYAAGAGLVVVSYLHHRDAQDAYDEGDAAYRQYQQAWMTDDVVYWRDAFTEADARGDRTVDKRNLMLGIAGAAFCIGVAFTIW